jgi:hypothetical protein
MHRAPLEQTAEMLTRRAGRCDGSTAIVAEALGTVVAVAAIRVAGVPGHTGG